MKGSAVPFKWSIVTGLLIVLFVLGFTTKLHAPLTYWDSVLLGWARSPAPLRASAATSPFFLLAIRILAGACSLGITPLRWFQAAGVLLSSILVCRLAVRLWGSPVAGMIALSLYILHPAVVQGAQSLDMADASFFPAAFTLWILEYASATRARGPRFALLVFYSGLAMACKTTSSLGLLFYPTIGMLWNLRDKRSLWPQCQDLLATAVGFLLCALPWWSFQNWEKLDSSILSAIYSVNPRDLGTTAFYAALGITWLGPFIAFLALMGAIRILRQKNSRLGAIVLGTAAYVFTYLIVGGMNHGFPRYHVAVLPVLCALSAYPEMAQCWNRRTLVVSLLLTTIFWGLVGDPIYALNSDLREAALNHKMWPFLFAEAFHWGIWLGVPAALQLLTSIPWPRFVLLSAWSALIALGIRQSYARYSTSYSYGEEGRAEVIKWITTYTPPGASLICPPNLTAEIRKIGLRGPTPSHWKTRETLLAYSAQARPRAVVLGLTSNSRWQLEWLLKEPPPPLQSCRERYVRIGSYWVCSLE